MTNTIQIARRASSVLYNFLKSNHSCNEEYLLPANICPIVPAVFCKAGITFRLVDIDEKTLCLNWDECINIAKSNLASKLNLLYVHSYGFIDPDFLTKLTQWKKIFPESKVIDDRCLAPPTLVKQSNITDIELYSTGYSKLLEIGHTGWGIWNGSQEPLAYDPYFQEDEHDKLINKFHISIDTQQALNADFSSPWLDLQQPLMTCEEISEAIKYDLPRRMNHKHQLNTIYKKYLNEWALPDDFNLWRFNILVSDPNKLLAVIKKSKGDFVSNHYKPLTKMYNQQNAPNTAKLGSHIINLFNDHRYDVSRAERLAKKLRKYLIAHEN